MYFTTLPDHSDPNFDEALHFSRFRQQNIVFNAISNRSHCDRHVGCLSIKTLTGGEEWYGVDKRQLVLRPGQMLILNNEQEYSCRVDTIGLVRISSLFFHHSFAASVFRDARSSEDTLLDNPTATTDQAPEFFQALHDIDPLLQRQLQELMQSLEQEGYDQDRSDERLLFILRHLILLHRKEKLHTKAVAATKPSTKQEIFKRLCIVKDYLHSSFMDRPGLTDLSRAACLSTPQLIRQFKAVFHTTPRQYLIGLQLAHAARLLQQTDTAVHEIGWQCGFADSSAFCRAFRAKYSVSPQHYRNRA